MLCKGSYLCLNFIRPDACHCSTSIRIFDVLWRSTSRKLETLSGRRCSMGSVCCWASTQEISTLGEVDLISSVEVFNMISSVELFDLISCVEVFNTISCVEVLNLIPSSQFDRQVERGQPRRSPGRLS